MAVLRFTITRIIVDSGLERVVAMEALQERQVNCPYCGESISLLLDFEEVGDSYIEDCSVCCQPMVVSLYPGEDGELVVEVSAENT